LQPLQAWLKATPRDSTNWFIVHDLLTQDASRLLGDLALKLDVPCFGLHLSNELLSESGPSEAGSGTTDEQEVATVYTEAVHTIFGTGAAAATDGESAGGSGGGSGGKKSGGAPMVLASYSASGARVAFHIAQQLLARGRHAVAVLLDAEDDLLMSPHAGHTITAAGAVAANEPIAYQAMYAKVLAAGTAVRWDKFYDVLHFSAGLDEQLETLRHAYKPEQVAKEEWQAGMAALLQHVQATFEQAQLGLPTSKLRSAHEALGVSGTGTPRDTAVVPLDAAEPDDDAPKTKRKFLPRRITLPF
jgi:hypothetical protein